MPPFAISYPDGRLQTISTADGSIEGVAEVVGALDIIQWNGLKWNAQDDVVYAMGLDSVAEPFLYRLDVVTGAVTLVGDMSSATPPPIRCSWTFAIDADGNMVAKVDGGGMKIAGAGFCIALLGYVVALTGHLSVGVGVGCVGWIVGVIGLGIYATHVLRQRRSRSH